MAARLMLGDCLEVMATLPAASVDVIVTSPPYNIGIRYGAEVDDARPEAAYLAWTGAWVREAVRLLRPTGSLFLNMGSKPTAPWVPFDVAQEVRQQLTLQNTFHWIKAIALDDDTAVGHYKPINSPRFVNDCHEYVFHFTHHGSVPLDRQAVGVRYQDASNATRWAQGGSGKRCRGNTWFIPYKTIQNRDRDRPHPATFPLELPRRCLRLHGLEHIQMVLDPFAGLGTTARACVELGLDCIGIELVPEILMLAQDTLREVA